MPSYLLQRGSTLYFRIKVPDDVRHVIHCTEIKLSLLTGYRHVAKTKVLLMAGICHDAFSKIREGILISQTEIDKTLHYLIRPSSQQLKTLPKTVTRRPNSPKLSLALTKYLADSKAKLGERSFASYRAILHEFREIIGKESTLINQLTHELIREYKESIQRLPKNMNKIGVYRDKTIRDLLKIDIPEHDRMSRRTLNMRMVIVKGFLKWLTINYGFQHDFNPLLTLDGPKRFTKSEREPWSNSDLLALFSTNEYNSQKSWSNYKYWIPLIALYEGMRLNEICQLYVSNIRKISETWCFDINDNADDKRIKTPSSKRVIPIHPKLIELGLLELLSNQKKAQHKRLFTDLSYGKSGYSDTVSKWFARHKKKCGIESKTKVFHSVRNTVSTRLKHKKVPLSIAAQLLGHKLNKESITYDYYADGYKIEDLMKAIKCINYQCLSFM